MNPLGIALAFVLFWCTIGLGLFLTFNAFFGLGKAVRGHSVSAAQGTAALARPLLQVGLLVLGLALVAAGAYANYVVIYR